MFVFWFTNYRLLYHRLIIIVFDSNNLIIIILISGCARLCLSCWGLMFWVSVRDVFRKNKEENSNNLMRHWSSYILKCKNNQRLCFCSFIFFMTLSSILTTIIFSINGPSYFWGDRFFESVLTSIVASFIFYFTIHMPIFGVLFIVILFMAVYKITLGIYIFALIGIVSGITAPYGWVAAMGI